MKVLLVEPNYNSKYAPLGLMKISAMLKRQGHEVSFIKGRKIFPEKFDQIYITSLFTFWYKITIETILFYKHHYPKAEIKTGGIFASLMPNYIKQHTGIAPHFGLIPEAEKEIPDLSMNSSESSIVFTSRGCIRKCGFCIVPKVEGDLKPIEGWERYVDLSKPNITFWDNNWFAKGMTELEKDVKIIRDLIKRGIREVDFNQGLDARIFNDDIAKLLEGIPIKPIRFAFDNMSEDGFVQRGIETAQKYGLLKKQKWSGTGMPATIYVLYNFNDTPEDFYYRIREVIKAGGMSFPMQYAPHDDLDRKYVGRHWTKVQRDAVKTMTNNLGQISAESREAFEFTWGKTKKEFLDNINMTKKEILKKQIKRMVDNIRRRTATSPEDLCTK